MTYGIPLIEWDGFILLYSITDKNSLNALLPYIQNIKEKTKTINHNDVDHQLPMILLGSMCDLQSQRVITHEEVSKFVHEHNIALHLEVSSKTCVNVPE